MFGDRDIIARKTYAILQRAQKRIFGIFRTVAPLHFQFLPDAYDAKYPGNQMLISIPYAVKLKGQI